MSRVNSPILDMNLPLFIPIYGVPPFLSKLNVKQEHFNR